MATNYPAQLKRAAEQYTAAQLRADAITRAAAERLSDVIEAAHVKGGITKADIHRHTLGVWSRQWIDRKLGPGRRGSERSAS